MKFLLVALLITGFCCTGNGQSTDSTSIVVKPEKLPEFGGGQHGWLRFLEKNLDRDLAARNKAPKKITVVASFTVGTDGAVSDIMIDTDPGYGTANEMKRIIRLTDKKWKPALLEGQPVAYRIKQSLSFLTGQ